MKPLVLVGDARHLPLADESVHLVVTSPPYNCRINYDTYGDWLPWKDYWHGLIEPAMHECYRVLIPGGRIAVNMANVVRQDVPQEGRNGRPTQYQSRGGRKWCPSGSGGDSWSVIVTPRLWTLLESVGFLPREHLTWLKGNDPSDTPTTSTAWGTFASAWNPVLRAVSEPVFIASKQTHSRERGVSDLTPDEFKAWTRNAWAIPVRNAGVPHPAPFPVELPRRLIKLYSYVGDTVLDPFCGSGATLVAAHWTGRQGIGLDISARYARLADNRSSQIPMEALAEAAGG